MFLTSSKSIIALVCCVLVISPALTIASSDNLTSSAIDSQLAFLEAPTYVNAADLEPRLVVYSRQQSGIGKQSFPVRIGLTKTSRCGCQYPSLNSTNDLARSIVIPNFKLKKDIIIARNQFNHNISKYPPEISSGISPFDPFSPYPYMHLPFFYNLESAAILDLRENKGLSGRDSALKPLDPRKPGSLAATDCGIACGTARAFCQGLCDAIPDLLQRGFCYAHCAVGEQICLVGCDLM